MIFRIFNASKGKISSNLMRNRRALFNTTEQTIRRQYGILGARNTFEYHEQVRANTIDHSLLMLRLDIPQNNYHFKDFFTTDYTRWDVDRKFELLKLYQGRFQAYQELQEQVEDIHDTSRSSSETNGGDDSDGNDGGRDDSDGYDYASYKQWFGRVLFVSSVFAFFYKKSLEQEAEELENSKKNITTKVQELQSDFNAVERDYEAENLKLNQLETELKAYKDGWLALYYRVNGTIKKAETRLQETEVSYGNLEKELALADKEKLAGDKDLELAIQEIEKNKTSLKNMKYASLALSIGGLASGLSFSAILDTFNSGLNLVDEQGYPYEETVRNCISLTNDIISLKSSSSTPLKDLETTTTTISSMLMTTDSAYNTVIDYLDLD